MTYTIRTVANSLLLKSRHHGESLHHLKLQRLLYLLRGWALARHERAVFDEQPQAWPTGPTFATLHFELAHRFAEIPRTFVFRDFHPQAGDLAPMKVAQDEEFDDLLERVWERYGAQDQVALGTVVTAVHSPWEHARVRKEPFITDESLRLFYKSQLDAYRQLRESRAGGRLSLAASAEPGRSSFAAAA